jgi:hypothetical protein
MLTYADVKNMKKGGVGAVEMHAAGEAYADVC